MTPANFSAWDLDPAAFDALSPDRRIGFLARFAVLAPSGHNSQPWKLSVESGAVVIGPDMSRALPQSDANHRQLYLSVGCALENLLQAADYYGYRADVAREEKEGHPIWRVRLIGEPRPASERPADHPALAAMKRRTNRNPYEARMPEAAFIDWMRGLASDKLRVDLVSEGLLKNSIADVVSDALIEAMDDDGFRLELSGYVRNNMTREMTGMPMFGFGMPTPPSFLAPFLVKHFNVNRPSRKQDEALLKQHTPLFAILSTREDGPEAWVEAGRTFERAALEAERRGISTAPMAAAIQIGAHHQRLQKLLGTNFRPQVFFRVGYAAKHPPHSPRIPAEQVTR